MSPLLSNLFLDRLDRAVAGSGFSMVRYADDMVVVASTAAEAASALARLEQAAGSIGLTLGEEKTQLMAFDEGFAFLGEEFSTKYPADVGPRRSEPDRRALYVATDGAFVRLQKGQVIVELRNRDLLRAPSSLVGSVLRRVATRRNTDAGRPTEAPTASQAVRRPLMTSARRRGRRTTTQSTPASRQPTSAA